jgi:hypothetical protein
MSAAAPALELSDSTRKGCNGVQNDQTAFALLQRRFGAHAERPGQRMLGRRDDSRRRTRARRNFSRRGPICRSCKPAYDNRVYQFRHFAKTVQPVMCTETSVLTQGLHSFSS